MFVFVNGKKNTDQSNHGAGMIGFPLVPMFYTFSTIIALVH